MNIIKAAPLHLVCLSTQICDLGGQGYNSGVITKPIEGTFSALYTFDTDEGQKTLQTMNTVTLGHVFDSENYFVEFDGDDSSFSLKTLLSTKAGKVAITTNLGKNYSEMMVRLKAKFPNQVFFDIKDPAEILKVT